MKVTQLTVFLENRSGRLAEVAGLLGREGINIRGFSTTEAAEYGIVRLIVTDPVRARDLLHAAGFTTHFSQVICVRVPDEPGGLEDVEVLRDGLPGRAEPVPRGQPDAQLEQCLSVPLPQLVEDGPPGRVGQGPEHVAHGADDMQGAACLSTGRRPSRASRTVGELPDRAIQAGVIVRHASVHGRAGERGERTKRPSAPGARGGYLATR